MSQSRNRKLRTPLLLVLCLIVWPCVETSPVFAQRRSPSNSPPETPSQRWLPLPQGGSADLKQQVQWLQQLKGLLGTDPLRGESPPLPKFDPEQLKLLLDAMKQMSGGLPEGTQPPALNGITPEQVSKAMADPAMREQVRRMLDQFSRDGKLPQGGGDTDSKSASIPSTPTPRHQGTGNESPNRDRPTSGTGQDLAAMPRAMQELLQRLTPPAGRQPNGLPPEHDSATDGLNAARTDAETPVTKPIPRVGRQVGEREPGEADSPNDPNRPTPSPGAAPRPAGSQPRGTTQPPGGTRPLGPSPPVGTAPPKTAERMSGADVRSGAPRNREPMPEPSLPASVTEMLKHVPQDRDQFEPGQAGSRDSSQTSLPRNLRPSMSDSANGQSTGDSQSVGSGNSPPRRNSSPRNGAPENVPAQADNQTLNRDRQSRGSATPPDPPADAKRPLMDVRSELEERGFAQTLRKIVEQAREESLVAANDSSGSSAESSAARGDSTGGGLEGSAARMLEGLRKNLVETANERPAPATTPDRLRPESARPSVSQPDVERRSPSSPLTKAAGSILSNIATAPASTPVPVPSSRTASSGAVADPSGTGTRSTVGLLMLLAVLGLVWYFIPQLLAAISQSQRAGSPLGAEIPSADIRTRRDVVRAFHQYALRPATPAPTWWTHREVERQVAATTPALQPTIQTLADLYEQARYLPDDTDLTPDQIGSARRALEQCENASESNQRG